LGLIAKKGEELGYDALLTGDHILVPKNISSPYPYTEGGEFPGSASGESMEQLTLLAFLAGQTSKIRLVTSVIIVPHRNPLVAAKALATLDVLSQGRLVVGVGVGWMREEFEALGLPPFEERGAVTDEYIRAFKELWTSDDPHFEGKYVSFDNISFLPKPVQKPHIPLLIGGTSRAAIRRAARMGNGWHPTAMPPEELSENIQYLRRQTQAAGRDDSEVPVSISVPMQGGRAGRFALGTDPEEIGPKAEAFANLGVERMVISPYSDDPREMLAAAEMIGQHVIPHFAN
jgi:probable F420-dependent oxidoreductase